MIHQIILNYTIQRELRSIVNALGKSLENGQINSSLFLLFLITTIEEFNEL